MIDQDNACQDTDSNDIYSEAKNIVDSKYIVVLCLIIFMFENKQGIWLLLFFANEEKTLFEKHTTLQLCLTYGIVQVWVLGQVCHQSHCVLLHGNFIRFQKGTDNLQAIQFLHNGLAHYTGDL